MNKILQGFVDLGLDLETGKSPYIPLESIEDLIEKKITGNGCTVRRDSKPWCYFNLINVKEGSSIVGFEFKGYLSVQQSIDRTLDQLEMTRIRYNNESRKISERAKFLNNLLEKGEEALYSRNNL